MDAVPTAAPIGAIGYLGFPNLRLLIEGKLQMAGSADGYEVLWDQQNVQLTKAQFEIFFALASKPSKVFSNHMLYAFTHPNGIIDKNSDECTSSIRTLIKHARRKFREVDSSFNNPFNVRKLGYRWRKVVSKEEIESSNVSSKISIGLIDVYPDTHQIFLNGVEVPFTPFQRKVFIALAKECGQIFTYRDVYDIMRAKGFVAGRNQKGHAMNTRSQIKLIRRKLEKIDHTYNGIENIRGVGYRLKLPEAH